MTSVSPFLADESATAPVTMGLLAVIVTFSIVPCRLTKSVGSLGDFSSSQFSTSLHRPLERRQLQSALQTRFPSTLSRVGTTVGGVLGERFTRVAVILEELVGEGEREGEGHVEGADENVESLVDASQTSIGKLTFEPLNFIGALSFSTRARSPLPRITTVPACTDSFTVIRTRSVPPTAIATTAAASELGNLPFDHISASDQTVCPATKACDTSELHALTPELASSELLFTDPGLSMDGAIDTLVVVGENDRGRELGGVVDRVHVDGCPVGLLEIV